jgi:pilus assembly protein Flp/PilA
MVRLYIRLALDEGGATALEYAIMGGLIAIALIGVLGTFGDELVANFQGIESEMPTTPVGG